MNDNELFSSFMMLNEQLYDVFVQYILNGRCRAPPETELIEMLPTFQIGAKRDRRALQSKFKSWAKRMNFENGCLVLANTGRIIIPKEICDDLIMHMHLEKHTDLENIICQIRRTYTWTRKNFGMDRDIVVESIMRNCKKEECRKKMRLEIAKLGNSFCSGMPTIPSADMIPFGIPPPLPYFSPYHYPLPFPIPPVFSPSNFPFPVQFLKNIHTPENLKPAINECKYNSMENKEDAPKPKLTVANSSSDETNSAAKIMPGKFKKPKNIHEYKELMEAVRKNPREFPEILVSKKNLFLSSLGIAPKIICSIRTLKKFRKQFKRKQFMTRDCMIYRDRKLLRDRNKLKKCLKQNKQHNYLGLTFSKKSSLPRYEAENSASKQSQSSKTLKVLVGEQEDAGSSMKSVKLSDIEKNKPIELITIVSSDEESAEKHSFLSTVDETQEEDVKTNKKSNLLLRDFKDQYLETITEQPCDIDTDVENSNKNDSPKNQNEIEFKCSKNLDDSHENLEKEVKYKDCGNETNKNKPTISQKLRNAILKENIRLQNIHLLQSENHVNYPSSNLSSGSSTIPKEIHFSVPQFAVLQPTKAITMAANSITYLPSQLNSTQVVVRSVTPLSLQTPATDAASGQNNNVKIVYPVKLTKAASSKVVLIDKQQKGAYFVAPSYNKPLLSQNNVKILPQKIFNSKVSSIESSMFTPQLRQLKPKPRKNETMGNHGNSSKVDINEEMNRIAAWVYRMKSILSPCMLSNGEEKSVQKLLSQLDVGIHLVRKAKKSLKEIEHIMDSSEIAMEIGK